MGFLWRNGLRRGVLGGSRPWLYVFVILGTARVARRVAGRVPRTVFSGELKPGEALIITHYADQTLGDVP